MPQNLYEFRVVATRPTSENGVGMDATTAAAELRQLRSLFLLLADSSEILPRWERLVITHDVKGKPSHDARLVAAMEVHGLSRLLTFDSTDFVRYSNLVLLNPVNIVHGS